MVHFRKALGLSYVEELCPVNRLGLLKIQDLLFILGTLPAFSLIICLICRKDSIVFFIARDLFFEVDFLGRRNLLLYVNTLQKSRLQRVSSYSFDFPLGITLVDA